MSAQVMNTILGGGVFNARLMQNLRENKAFTYGAYSNLEVDRYNGSFTASVSVRTEVTDSAIVEIINELEKMRSAPVTEEELELAKNYMAGSFARSLEDPRTVARFALNTFLYDLPRDHYATYLKRLEAIGPKDVENAARDFLHPDHATIFVVGDRSQIGHKLTALASNPQAPLLVLDENGEVYQENLRPITDKNGQDVIDNYLNAIGGRSALEKIRSMYTEMTANIGGMDLTIKQWQGPDGRFRSETSAEKMGVLQDLIFDGERAVSRTPQGGQELTDADLLDVMAGAPPVPELRIDEFVERKTLGGITELGEEKVYKVVMATLAGTTVSDYYSVDTGLRVRRVDQKSMMGRPVTITTDHEDYREVEGIKIPHKIRQTGGPMGEMVIEVKKVELNKDVPPGHFSTGLPPPGSQED